MLFVSVSILVKPFLSRFRGFLLLWFPVFQTVANEEFEEEDFSVPPLSLNSAQRQREFPANKSTPTNPFICLSALPVLFLLLQMSDSNMIGTENCQLQKYNRSAANVHNGHGDDCLC